MAAHRCNESRTHRAENPATIKTALVQVMAGLMAGLAQAHRCGICSLNGFLVLLAIVTREFVSFHFACMKSGEVNIVGRFGCRAHTVGDVSSAAFKRILFM
jgi:hypothetical protein